LVQPRCRRHRYRALLRGRGLTTGSPRRYEIAAFLAWTTSRQLSTDLHVPRRQTKSTGQYLDDHQYAEQLQQCINDTELPLDVRLSGALTLLFGPTMPSIARLTDDDVDQRTDGVHLRIGEKFFQLAPMLAGKLNCHGTGIEWTRPAKTDWTTYLADRAANAQREREKWYPGN